MSTPRGGDGPRRGRPPGGGGGRPSSTDSGTSRGAGSGRPTGGGRPSAAGRPATGGRPTNAGRPTAGGSPSGAGGRDRSGAPWKDRPGSDSAGKSGAARDRSERPRQERPAGRDSGGPWTDSPGRPGTPADRAPARRAGGTGRPETRGGVGRAQREDSERREWVVDPRREERRARARVPLPDDIDPRDLDRQTRAELKTLAKDTADLVARHLVMAGRLLDDEPQEALRHARAARALAGRVSAVREANGIAAYLAGEWTEALSELRTARRMTGDPEHLPLMADCERALGRPDRALLLTQDPQGKDLAPEAQVELLIVGSGARRDLGQLDAAVAMLEVKALHGTVRPWTARLRYAYADALLAQGREEEARQWFARAVEADPEGETDAEERLLALDGIVLEDLVGDDEDDEAPTSEG